MLNGPDLPTLPTLADTINFTFFTFRGGGRGVAVVDDNRRDPTAIFVILSKATNLVCRRKRVAK